MNTQVGLAADEIDATAGATRPATRERGTFYFGMAVTMSLAVFVGFGPTFYLNGLFAEALGLPPLQAISPIVIVHGLVFTMWMIVLTVQTWLVAKGQVRWHRRLGVVGAVVAALVVVLGMAVQLASAQRDLSSGAYDANPFTRFVVFGGFVSIIVFSALSGAAIYWRRRPEIHRRLIIVATIALLGAATARIALIVGAAARPSGRCRGSVWC